MSRLSDLYQAMETLRKEGLELSDGLEKQVSELEEEIIKKEILPVITETIAPALKPVKRELVLVVDYVPDAPLSVHISRKHNIAAAIIDAKEITPNPRIEHTTHASSKPHNETTGKTILKITFGSVIECNKASETFRQFVLMVGIEKVRSLNYKYNKMPLVSNTLDDKYSQVPLNDGWYLMTHSSTKKKKYQIERIAKELHIDIKVEIV